MFADAPNAAPVSDPWPLGVFASIDAGLGVQLEVAHELGIPTIQLHAPRKPSRGPDRARWILDRLAALQIRLTAIFGGFEGESYTDIPAVARTVGLVPRAPRAVRLDEMRQIADFARLLNVEVVGLHLGCIPHDADDPLYGEAVAVARQLCDDCLGNGQALHLETGQEPASVLFRFIHDVQRENLFINFDPANMILYGSGNPIEALEQLGPFVRSVHCKDARRSAHPGQQWGLEVPLGEGDVGFDTFFRVLNRVGYRGPLTIEREIPQDPERQKAEIGHAARLLERLKAENR